MPNRFRNRPPYALGWNLDAEDKESSLEVEGGRGDSRAGSQAAPRVVRPDQPVAADKFHQALRRRAQAAHLPRFPAGSDRVDVRPEGVEHESHLSIQQFQQDDVCPVSQLIDFTVDGASTRMTPPRARDRFARDQADDARQPGIGLEEQAVAPQGRQRGIAARRRLQIPISYRLPGSRSRPLTTCQSAATAFIALRRSKGARSLPSFSTLTRS